MLICQKATHCLHVFPSNLAASQFKAGATLIRQLEQSAQVQICELHKNLFGVSFSCLYLMLILVGGGVTVRRGGELIENGSTEFVRSSLGKRDYKASSPCL